MVDFKAVNERALSCLQSLLGGLLPGGTVSGGEYKAKNPTRADRHEGSFSINLSTGKWKDFADGSHGTDVVGLYAYVKGISQGEAARAIDSDLGTIPDRPAESARESQSSKQSGSWVEVRPALVPVPKWMIDIKSLGGFPSLLHCYKNEEGKTIGYVGRYDPKGTRKQFIPFTFRKNEETDEHQWRRKQFDSPRPLYKLEDAAGPETVLVVEGEKCVDALSGIEGLWVTTWPGGSQAVDLVDFGPLRDRNVIIWPDNDEDGGGGLAALRIAQSLKDTASSVRVFDIDKYRKPWKWDSFDAVSTDKWSLEKVRSEVSNKKNTFNPFNVDLKSFLEKGYSFREISRMITGKTRPLSGSSEREVDRWILNAPFQILGQDHGTYFYLPEDSEQIIELSRQEHRKVNLLTIAPLKYWRDYFPKGNFHVDWDTAVDNLFRAGNKLLYSPNKIRGRGAWFDAGRPIFHTGEKILCEGKLINLKRFESEYIYEKSERLVPKLDEPLSCEGARDLEAVVGLLSFERAVSKHLLAGWVVLAPVCAALLWRSHIWLTGGAGTGKSWILENIIARLISPICLFTQGATTEAGMRQALGADGLPVIQDEAESEGEGAVRQQKILELARQASAENQAEIYKGSAKQKSQKYSIRSAFCLASIGVAVNRQADQSRFAVLSLKRNESPDQFGKLKKACGQVLTDDYIRGFQARSFSMIPVIRKNTEIFCDVLVDLNGWDRRQGDQYGTLLGAAYTLRSDDPVTTEAAEKLVRSVDWSFTEGLEESDERRCIRFVTQKIVTVDLFDSNVRRSIRELLQMARKEKEAGEVDPVDGYIERALQRHGLKLSDDKRSLYIQKRNSELDSIFRGTGWQGENWSESLRRLDGAENGCRPIFLGRKSYATKIPIKHIFDE